MARPLIRIFVLVVLTILLAAPWSAAAPRKDSAPAPQLLAQLLDQVVALWRDIGCIMDPGGGCRESSVTTGDIGCGIDPGGGCRESSTPAGDIGCGMDPNGGCGH